MSHELYELKVQNITRQTEDCVSVEFAIPDSLQEIFQYTQGQYISLEKELNGQLLRRSYSLCSAPFEKKWCIAVKEVHNGIFSCFVNQQLKIGDSLSVQVPGGRFFTKLEPGQSKRYVFFAAGSGITPVLGIIKQILHVEPESSVILFYGSQRTEQIIFLEELLALKNLNINRLAIHFLLSREETEEELFHGRINGEKLNRFTQSIFKIEDIDEFFMCGPETMILELREQLQRMGVDPHHIHMELFGVQIQKPKPHFDHAAGTKNCLVRMTLDGRTFEFNLPFNTDNLLDAALKQGANLPYACKGGVCCTCKTKLLKGDVEMMVNYGLEADEIEQGYILSCQSFPKSSKIEVNFDQ